MASRTFHEIKNSLRNNLEKHKKNFFENINIPFDATNNECWEWTGRLNKDGYGLLFMSFTAHRFSYHIFKGWQPKNSVVMHKCNNRKCINPNHLELGTHGENISQSYFDGRQTSKETFFKRPSNDQIKEIRILYKNKISQLTIAEKFNINQATISRIVNRKGAYA